MNEATGRIFLAPCPAQKNLDLHTPLLFRIKITRTKFLYLTPEWMLVFGSNPPCLLQGGLGPSKTNFD
jgi:hypothetical protein